MAYCFKQGAGVVPPPPLKHSREASYRDMRGLLPPRDDYPSRKAVFEVQTADVGPVYMSVERTPFRNAERCAVIVDSRKFLELWRRDPYLTHAEVSNGNPDTWVQDYKYPEAEHGFSHGFANPVPLAEVVCQTHVQRDAIWKRRYLFFRECVGVQESRFAYVAFSNGITRTIWLLVHGAEYFPVECDASGAEALARAAGYDGPEYQTVGTLTSRST